MNWNENYKFWINNVSKEEKDEIDSFSEEQKKQFFSKDFEFGTAGIRGVIGYAPSLFNKYVVAKYALAFGKTLLEKYGQIALAEGIVIAHDNRRNNILFSETAARVISNLGIPVFFFAKNELQPTPLLSYTIAKGNYVGGINITASHNPPEYSGLKVYGHTGTQMLPETTQRIETISKEIKDIFHIKESSENIRYLNNGVVTQYIDTIQNMILFNHDTDRSNLNIVFTPQHGTATYIATEILNRLGVKYELVKEQSYPDSEFSNTISANPQNPDSFIMAREYGDRNNADILFCTDPDADRFGIEVKHDGKWVHIDGNELPLIQLNFKLKKLFELDYIKEGDFIIKSVVTSDAAIQIANKYGVNTFESLTGFKWLINEAFKHEMNGDECLFAWEESYGSTIRTFTRDKDSFQALTQVIELASEYKKQGKTLIDVLDDIYKEIGYYKSEQIQIKTSGNKAIEEMDLIISGFRKLAVGDKINRFTINEIRDFSKGYKNFFKDNIMIFILDNENRISIRPSGTEPILRVYYDIHSNSKNEVIKDKELIENEIILMIEKFKKDK